MRIKKHKNQNEYLLTQDNIWVRNFQKEGPTAVDINKLTNRDDYGLLLRNQITNQTKHLVRIDTERIHHRRIVIVSDGHGFANKHEMLALLPKDVIVLAVNGALAKWRLLGNNPIKLPINYFIVNNPYSECLNMLPKSTRYFPKCIASIRTNPDFIKSYKGIIYQYIPVPEESYAGPTIDGSWLIDDYRNPLCAALGLANKFGAEEIMLFCVDDVYEEARPGASKLHNDLYMYPTQLICQRLIDSYLYWYKQRSDVEIKIGIHSSGPVYDNATYITEKDVASFFCE